MSDRISTFGLLILVALAALPALCQSSDQSFPSPVTQNEISAAIRARDVGDARLTTHFWAFEGSPGDLFINVVTQNFSGDIDIYQAADLKPLTKMVMFADSGPSETGRVIYMRQPGRLLLRVQGRSPNDDPATYKIKFAGSFVALAPQRDVAPPTVGSVEDTGIKVNSVGTIVAVTPRSTATEKKDEPPPEKPSPAKQAAPTETTQAEKPVKRSDNDGVQTIFGNKSAKVTVNKPPSGNAKPPNRQGTSAAPIKPKADSAIDPLAGTSLIIMLRDGTRIERPMSEVTRFMMDHGALTIFARDGTIHRFPAAELSSVTIR